MEMTITLDTETLKEIVKKHLIEILNINITDCAMCFSEIEENTDEVQLITIIKYE